FCSADTAEGDLEDTRGVGFEGDVDLEEQIRGQRAECRIGRGEPRGRETGEKKNRAERVDQMVEIEAITRTLFLADSRERSIEAVSEPVEEEAQVHAQES